MIELRDASVSDLALLHELALAGNDAPYPLARVLESKCFGAGMAGAPLVTLASVDGRAAGFSVVCGNRLRLLAVAKEQRRRGVGTRLLQAAERRIGGTVVIAAEAGNYFTPGVWSDDRGSRALLERHGYAAIAATDNLYADVRTVEAPDVLHIRRPAFHEREAVLAFIEATFGKIWRFESAPAFAHDPPNAFVAEHDGRLAGFVVHEANNRGLGFFGPTGVTAELRGRGLGRDLLLASLVDLRRLGYDQVVIPWTDALAFYRKSCGAEPRHHFVTYAKEMKIASG